jgi:hypothetical protein
MKEPMDNPGFLYIADLLCGRRMHVRLHFKTAELSADMTRNSRRSGTTSADGF